MVTPHDSRVDSDSRISESSTWVTWPLILMFAGSGFSALIYEIVWFQMLQLVIGASAVSLGVLLGTFMGGMCLGSLLFAKLRLHSKHPLQLYALLEIGIAMMGVLILYAMPWVHNLYVANVLQGYSSMAMRTMIASFCLLPPTMLMGATLPAIARWVESTKDGVTRLGYFYGANISGGVLGSLLAGFYLLRNYDTVVATWLAVGVNLVVAFVAWILSKVEGYEAKEHRAVANEDDGHEERLSIYLAIGLSGLSALGAEVLWTRILSLVLGATTYTFSLILAVFLVGLGIGSSLASSWITTLRSPRIAFAAVQVALAWALAWASWMVSQSIPYWPIDPSLSRSPWLTFQLDIVRCGWAILPAAILWGASFPLALATVANRRRDPATLVAGVYSANTIGAIVGALGFSLVTVQTLGTLGGQKILIAISVVAAAIVLIPNLRPSVKSRTEAPSHSQATRPIKLGSVIPSAMLLLLAISSLGLMSLLRPIPPGLTAYGRYIATWFQEPNYLYVGEGMNASIAVSENENGDRSFHVSGKTVASSLPADMRLQRMLGHFPAFLHPNPKSVLIVGCGAGVTAGTFVLHPSIERIVICEIEPLIPPAANRFFGEENHHVMEDPRVEVVFDDARHYVQTTHETFDIITSDPIHPWVKGAASLYSQEYYGHVLRHLNPGGIVTQWVPLYETSLESVKSEVMTFFEAFPHGTIWANESQNEGYDMVMLGQEGPTQIDFQELDKRISRSDLVEAQKMMEEVGLGSALRLILTYTGRRKELEQWYAGSEINRDRGLRLQYLAGLSSNLQNADQIYRSMLSFRVYPTELFSNPRKSQNAIQELMNRPPN